MPVEFLGFTIWIATDNGEVDEYAVQIEDDNTVTCYIPSEHGKQFKICWLDESRLRKSVVACYMDGRPVGGKPSQKRTSGALEGVYTPSNRLRPFQFSSVVTTDDDDLADPSGVDPDLGCIQVEIHEVQPNIQKDRSASTHHGQVHDVGPVHERSKKLGAHCVALGTEQEHRRPDFLAPNYKGNGPFAIFKFFYRPIELLKARGIIPPPPEAADIKPHVDEKSKTEPASEGSQQDDPNRKPGPSYYAESHARGDQVTRKRPRFEHQADGENKRRQMVAGERRRTRQTAKVKREENTLD